MDAKINYKIIKKNFSSKKVKKIDNQLVMAKRELVLKKGYYEINKITEKAVIKYEVDSGQYLFVERFKKYIVNPYRDKKTFKTLEKAKEYVGLKLIKQKKRKEDILKTLPKSLYLVLIKEVASGKTFVKVGITSKRFIMRRFSKAYGYDGYILESILRRVDTPDAEKYETEIKELLNKKRSVKKYRPLMESFSGYSECFDYAGLDDIVNIFDKISSTC
jgi:DNA-binding Lrp family transcriptional regulator